MRHDRFSTSDAEDLSASFVVPNGPLVATTSDPTAIAGLAVSDPDAGIGMVMVDLGVQNGILRISDGVASGLSPDQIEGNGSPSVRLTGRQEAINATLAATGGVQYASLSGYAGSDTLAFTAADNGNTGTGGSLSATKSVVINVSHLKYSSWQATAFSAETPAADRLPEADPEKDGRPNVLEYFSGSDPLLPDLTSPAVELSAGFLTAVFPRSKRIDPAFGQPVSASDLKTWSTTGLVVVVIGELSPAVELVRVSAPLEPGFGGQGFLSWKVPLQVD